MQDASLSWLKSEGFFFPIDFNGTKFLNLVPQNVSMLKIKSVYILPSFTESLVYLFC